MKGKDLTSLTIPQDVPKVSMDQVRTARRVVASMCGDAVELSHLLESLGIGRRISPDILVAEAREENRKGKNDV